jgi:hypothetical protein
MGMLTEIATPEVVLKDFGLPGVIIFMLWKMNRDMAGQVEAMRKETTARTDQVIAALVENTKAQTALCTTISTLTSSLGTLSGDLHDYLFAERSK